MSVKLLMNDNAEKKMWIGWIPQDIDGTGFGISKEEEMAEEFNIEVMNFGIMNQSLVEVNKDIVGKYSINIPEGGFFAAVVPKNHVVTFDDGFGGKVVFSNSFGEFIQNGMPLKDLIDNKQFFLYGIMFNTGGDFTFYVDAV